MSSALLASSLSSSLASTAGMRALVAERARVQRLLDFAVALARAQAAVGVVPALATDKIAEAARAERYDAAVLAADAAGGIVPALISALTAEVARSDAEAARVVGFGASEQDALDTALALELRDAIDLIDVDPVSGNAQANRVVPSSPAACDVERVTCTGREPAQ